MIAFGLLAACSPPVGCPCLEPELVDVGCPYPEPEFIDVSGEWSADELEELRTAFDAWTADAGEGRVCIDRVEVDRVPQGVALDHSSGAVVRIDVTIGDRAVAMYQALCRELDLREDLSSRLDGGIDDYAEACEDGRVDYGWVEEVEAACGGTALTATDELMREVVYPLAPRARVDGDVHVVEEEALRIPGLLAGGWTIERTVRDGEALVLGLHEGGISRLVRVDPGTGATTQLFEIELMDLDDKLSGGPGGAVLLIDVPEVSGRMMVVLDEGVLLAVPNTVPMRGVVADGWYYAVAGSVISAVDLSSGWSTTVPVPAPSGWSEVNPNYLYALPAGFAATVANADGDESLYQYDPAASSYRLLLPDADAFSAYSSLGGDRIGIFAEGRAGTVLAVFDIATDRLLVSDDVCVDRQANASTSDRMWWVEADGDDVVLTAIRFE